MRPFHQPGVVTRRYQAEYSEDRDIKQRALSDAAYSAAYDFAGCRQPTPGVTLAEGDVQERLSHVAEGWAYEAGLSRGRGTSAFDPRIHLPPGAQYHLAERLMPYPQTDRPWDRKLPEAEYIE